MIAGRIPGYLQYKDTMSAEDYVDRVQEGFAGDPDGFFDPVLTTQLAAGFTIERLVPGYIHDPSSLNYGVHMVWRNPEYRG